MRSRSIGIALSRFESRQVLLRFIYWLFCFTLCIVIIKEIVSFFIVLYFALCCGWFSDQCATINQRIVKDSARKNTRRIYHTTEWVRAWFEQIYLRLNRKTKNNSTRSNLFKCSKVFFVKLSLDQIANNRFSALVFCFLTCTRNTFYTSTSILF